jgi:hypothetical protein
MLSTSTLVLATGFSLAAVSMVPSCATKEIAPGEGNDFEVSQVATATQQANLSLSIASDADTWEEDQHLASLGSPLYNFKIDGRWAVIVGSDGERYPIQFSAGGSGIWTGNWIPAGSHVFEMVEPNGTTALTTPAIDVQSDHANRLVMFGHKDALEHRILDYTFDVPADMVRYSVINLVRSGETIQVVKCDSPGGDGCTTPVSDPVAYGEAAGGDVMAQPGTLAYRLFPAGGGAPLGPPYPLSWDVLASELHPAAVPTLDPPVFVGAPCMVTSGSVSISLY